MARAGWSGLSEPSRTVALEVLRHGPLSRSELARRLDLSAGTLTRLSRPLVDAGILVESGGAHETPAGRRARPLIVAVDADHFVGVRLTGDHAWAVATTLRADAVAQAQRPLSGREPDAVVAAVRELVEQVSREVPAVTGVGIALGGQVDAAGAVLRAPFLGWSRVLLGELLTSTTGLATVVENDVIALTTAEAWFGAGRRVRSLALVTIGTGVGAGLVHDGRVVNSREAGIGLIGHLPLGLPGPVCALGHRGCCVGVLTDGSILAQAAATLQRPVDHAELLDLVITREHPGVNRIADDVAAGLGRLVAMIANITQVPLVVVSGEGLVLAELLQHRVRREAAVYRDPAAPPVELVFQPSEGSRWARGAAAIAIQRYVTQLT